MVAAGRARGGSASRCGRSRIRCAPTCRSCSARRVRRTSQLAAEIADGWMPLYYSPFRRRCTPSRCGRGGQARLRDVRERDGLRASPTTSKRRSCRRRPRSRSTSAAWARSDRNFHMELMSRMGFEAEAHKIQELFFEGRRDEAIPLVPTAVRRRDLARRFEGTHPRPARGVEGRARSRRSSSTATSTRCARWRSWSA